MTYMIDDPSRFPRKYKIVNIESFAADLAKLLAGTVVPSSNMDDDTATIVIPNCPVELHLTRTTWSEAKAKRMTISAFVPGIPHDDRPFPASTYGAQYALPTITVSAERMIELVARDIEKRVIDPAAAPAAAIREFAAKKNSGRDNLRDAATVLREKYPLFTFGEQQRDSYRVPFSWYAGAPGKYEKFVLSGFVNSDGTVTVERMATLSPVLFEALVKAMG